MPETPYSSTSVEQARSIVNRMGLPTQTGHDYAVGQIAAALDAAWAAGFANGELSAKLKRMGLLNGGPAKES